VSRVVTVKLAPNPAACVWSGVTPSRGRGGRGPRCAWCTCCDAGSHALTATATAAAAATVAVGEGVMARQSAARNPRKQDFWLIQWANVESGHDPFLHLKTAQQPMCQAAPDHCLCCRRHTLKPLMASRGQLMCNCCPLDAIQVLRVGQNSSRPDASLCASCQHCQHSCLLQLPLLLLLLLLLWVSP